MPVQATIQAHLSYQPYHRLFRQPLQTHHGLWQQRDGILLRLRDPDGRVGYGEIAPIDWFGSESWAEALAWCQAHSGWLDLSELDGIPLAMTATRFGLSCAGQDLHQDPADLLDWDQHPPIPMCGLLGSCRGAFAALESFSQPEQWGAFKLKIGLEDPALEQDQIRRLLAYLPGGIPVRLDANGGLNPAQLETWLQAEDLFQQIEFIEQPLPPDGFEAMLQASQQGRIPLALDESVAGLAQLSQCYERGWRQLVVLKPAISGSVGEWVENKALHALDRVVSAAFETVVGTYHAARLTRLHRLDQRAVGFGLDHWLAADGGNPVDPFRVGLLAARQHFEAVWVALGGQYD